MKKSQRALCFIVAVLGFTFFPGLAESKGTAGFSGMHYVISHGVDLQEFPSNS